LFALRNSVVDALHASFVMLINSVPYLFYPLPSRLALLPGTITGIGTTRPG
jgi:hypothetical protein